MARIQEGTEAAVIIMATTTPKIIISTIMHRSPTTMAEISATQEG